MPTLKSHLLDVARYTVLKVIVYCSPCVLNSVCLDLCWLTSQVWDLWQGKTCWSFQFLLRCICSLPHMLKKKPAIQEVFNTYWIESEDRNELLDIGSRSQSQQEVTSKNSLCAALFGWHWLYPVFALWTRTNAFLVSSKSGVPIPFLSLSILPYY